MAQSSIAIRGGTIGVFQPSAERLSELGAWFDSEYPALLRFAYFVCGDRAGAEDLVQDAFVRIYRAGARVDAAKLPAYARKTLVNAHRSAFRKRRGEREALKRTERADRVDAPDASARDEMWRAVLQLSPRQRAVVALRFYEDLTEREIAETLGMSAGAVKKQASRAMDKLRELVGRQP